MTQLGVSPTRHLVPPYASIVPNSNVQIVEYALRAYDYAY
jgi:hypothetical protein